jgi:hypothetical protein
MTERKATARTTTNARAKATANTRARATATGAVDSLLLGIGVLW